MDNEKLVELVTTEVLRQLKQLNGTGQLQPGGARYKALAIFTGGTIGLDTGLEELSSIQALNTEITVVLSEAAEKIVGVNRIQEKLGSHINIVTTQSPYPGKFLREADIVLVPVLTQNTAAKLAYTLSDTMVSTLILQALMFGKPVIAAVNAADPQDSWRVQKNMAKSSPALREALQANLNKIETYGIQLTPVENLTTQAKKVMFREVKPRPVREITSKKQVLDAATVKSAVQSGAKTLTVTKGTLVTPLARDIARENNVEILHETL
ncbi:Coenzyme A biosynthesis bifunctional protein CoaBC [Sporomusa carbonis]|uniref:flavoprotein n=1 Tax=Sporomusa carbonis TaxID=3076075 RepID=UPI003A7A7B00